MAKVLDISPEISQKTAVFPGDRVFSQSISMDFGKGDHLMLSSINTTVHVGAHTDAPSHYHASGQDIAGRPLDYYLGPCQVVEVKLKRGERIRSIHLEKINIEAPRILFKTNSFPDPNQWNNDFNSLSAEGIDFLASRGVKLVGIDTPSIDLADDKDLESHQAIFKNNLAILEGVVLSHVAEGLYTLIALPLKIKGADASPVRAVLVKGEIL